MKKYVCLAILIVNVIFNVSAQNKICVTVRFLMPNLARQDFKIYGITEGISLFKQIVGENLFNVSQINLNEKPIHAGELIKVTSQTFITESDAYRCLANELCESCSNLKSITKKDGAILFVRANSGQLCIVDVYWLDDIKEWCIHIVPNINSGFSYTSKKDRTNFY
jgi:hypothetical protein